MTYAMPDGNVTRINGLFEWANMTTGYNFAWMLVLCIWFIIFLALKNYPTKNAFSAASFISAICAILLKLAGLTMNDFALFVTIFASAISIVWLIIDQNPY